MRLIDADKAREEATIDLVVHLLDRQPTVEAKPVVHAHWEVVSTETDKWVNKCSACGAYLKRGYKQTNYCPNCGAKMFGKEGAQE